jgi:hypothetical protein
MLLIAEIVLTVVACIRLNKAGKSWALGLIPVGLTAFFGFVSGFAGYGDAGAMFVLDCLCVVVLVALCFVKGK